MITTGKKTYVDEQSPKNLRVPEAPALPLLRARRGTGRGSQRAAEMWFLSGAVAEDEERSGLKEDCGYMAATGRERGSGESQKTERR